MMTSKDIIISFFLVFFTILATFNFLLFSNGYHKEIIKTYNTNETFFEYDRNVTRFVTGFDNSLDVPFDYNEKSHLNDVRKLIIIEEIIFVISLISLFVLILTRQINFLSSIKICAIIIIAILMILFLLMPYFDNLFIAFHKIFFPQGNWMFASGSLMIETYNQVFFEKFFVYTFAISAFIIILSYIILEIIKNIIIVTRKENEQIEK
jgi:uncharacterized membrane protein